MCQHSILQGNIASSLLRRSRSLRSGTFRPNPPRRSQSRPNGEYQRSILHAVAGKLAFSISTTKAVLCLLPRHSPCPLPLMTSPTMRCHLHRLLFGGSHRVRLRRPKLTSSRISIVRTMVRYLELAALTYPKYLRERPRG